MTDQVRTPPMEQSGEANLEQLEMARQQGRALMKALEYMANKEADDGGQQRAGDYLVAYAVEKAEGLYMLKDGELEWQEPKEENVHIEVAVLDGADHRFVPGLTVHVTVIARDGTEIGTYEQPFLWHPWLYHYGRNWKVPSEGQYKLRIRIEPPKFMRHDRKNGKRYAESVQVQFDNVHIKTGQK